MGRPRVYSDELRERAVRLVKKELRARGCYLLPAVGRVSWLATALPSIWWDANLG